jgi:hypothetical protein
MQAWLTPDFWRVYREILDAYIQCVSCYYILESFGRGLDWIDL